MTFFEIAGFLSLVVTFLVYVIYIPSIFLGHTKPHIFSWIIFSLFTGALFWIQYQAGSGAGSWSTAMTTIACFLITGLCFKYGTTDITSSDKVSFIFALIAFVGWLVTNDPLITLGCMILAEGLAFYPVFRKSYVHPYEEPLHAYSLSALKMILSVAATEHYNVYTLSYPIIFTVLYSAFVMMLIARRKVVPLAKMA